MRPRVNPYEAAPNLLQPLIDVSYLVSTMGLDPTLRELVRIRASQINGSPACLDMNVRDARWNGETEERILMLDAWRDSFLYTKCERAALAWTEALTRLPDAGAPDDVYEQVAEAFSVKEQVKLTLLIVMINAFNRIGVGFRVPPLDLEERRELAA